MAKLSEEEEEQLAALQARRDAPDEDEDDDYAWVRTDGGGTVRLHGKRLRAYLKKHGLDDGDVADSSKADPLDPADGAPPAKKAAPAKKTAGKKIAPNSAGGTADDGDGAAGELDTDEPPARRRPVFF